MLTTIGMRRILKNLEDDEFAITHYKWFQGLTLGGFNRMLSYYVDKFINKEK